MTDKNRKARAEDEAATAEANAGGVKDGGAEGPVETPSADSAAGGAVAELEARLAKAEASLAEMTDAARRTMADFQNYKARASKDAAAARRFTIRDAAVNVLPAFDNLERALGAVESGGDALSLSEGVRLTLRTFVDGLGKLGVARIEPRLDRSTRRRRPLRVGERLAHGRPRRPPRARERRGRAEDSRRPGGRRRKRQERGRRDVVVTERELSDADLRLRVREVRPPLRTGSKHEGRRAQDVS
jgi:molecular chaperone GrpE (heat shock protein)